MSRKSSEQRASETEVKGGKGSGSAGKAVGKRLKGTDLATIGMPPGRSLRIVSPGLIPAGMTIITRPPSSSSSSSASSSAAAAANSSTAIASCGHPAESSARASAIGSSANGEKFLSNGSAAGWRFFRFFGSTAGLLPLGCGLLFF